MKEIVKILGVQEQTRYRHWRLFRIFTDSGQPYFTMDEDFAMMARFAHAAQQPMELHSAGEIGHRELLDIQPIPEIGT